MKSSKTSYQQVMFHKIHLLLYIFIGLIVTGCTQYEHVSKENLIAATEHWKEPKVATWYYQGSDESYHYFNYYDLSINKHYKVSRDEIVINNPYPFGEEKHEMRVMPWGPRAFIP